MPPIIDNGDLANVVNLLMFSKWICYLAHRLRRSQLHLPRRVLVLQCLRIGLPSKCNYITDPITSNDTLQIAALHCCCRLSKGGSNVL